MNLNKVVISLLLVGLCSLLFLFIPCYGDDSARMQKYWKSFRQAVISGDTDKVASLTHFPFAVGGILDSHPVVMYDHNTFSQILVKLLSQRIAVMNGEKVTEKTVLQHIKDKKEITTKDFSTPEMVTIEVLEFKRLNGKWLFTGAYLEE